MKILGIIMFAGLSTLGAYYSYNSFLGASDSVRPLISEERELMETPLEIPASPNLPNEGPKVKIGDIAMTVEIAETDAELRNGLSGRLSLDPDKGMFFVFNKPAIHRFWMPDMHFPIDIIWIEEGKVVAINSDVLPIFDPEDPRFYTPPKPVQYVLEVNGGFARKHNINIGDSVVFEPKL